MHLSDILGTLGSNITAKSFHAFIRKFTEILTIDDKDQFEELFGELQFARVLCSYVSPISFEPYVPPSHDISDEKPKSPDYGVRLPDADVAIEVTTFRFGVLTKWSRANELLKEQLSNQLKIRRISSQIKVTSSKEFLSISMLPNDFIEVLVDEISHSQTGAKSFRFNNLKMAFEWQPLLIFDTRNQSCREPGEGEVASFAFGFTQQLYKEDSEEIFFRSFRNLLNNKKKKYGRLHISDPIVLAIQLGHPVLTFDSMKLMLQTRIWPNLRNNWLAGVYLFSPVKPSSQIQPPRELHYAVNPNSDNPFPNSLIQIMEHGNCYHLRDGKFCAE